MMSTEPASQPNLTSEDGRPAAQPTPTTTNTDISDLSVSWAPPSSKMAPREAAVNHVESFLQTLRYSDQQRAYKNHALKYLAVFGDYYCESKKIVKALGEGENYCPPNCTVKLPFQPIEGVKGDAAYLSLANELAAFTKQTKLTLGKFNLRGLTINNQARKTELVRILCTATAHIAELVLAEFDLEAFGPHNLVADFLLQHHDAFLATRTTLQCFCQRYKSYNNCGHAQVPAGELYDLKFGKTAAITSQQPAAANIPPASAAPPAASSTAANRVLDYAPTEKNATAPAATQAGTAITPADSTSPLRMVTGSGTVYQKVLSSAPDKEGQTPLPAPAVLPPGTPFVPAAQLLAALVATQTPASATAPAQTNSSQNDEEEMCFLAEEASRQAQLEKSRRFECNKIVLIDSIRPKSSLGLPKTPAAAAGPAAGSTATTDQTAASAAADVPTDSPPMDASRAISALHRALFALFVDSSAAYITQYNHNLTASKMAKLSNEKALLEAAKDTACVIAEEAGDAIPKSISSIVNESVDKANKANKRKHQSENDTLRSMVHKLQADAVKEKAKRAKLERQIQSLSNPKESGAMDPGATQKNLQSLKSNNRNRNRRSKARHSQGAKEPSEADDAGAAATEEPPQKQQESNKQQSGKRRRYSWKRKGGQQR